MHVLLSLQCTEISAHLLQLWLGYDIIIPDNGITVGYVDYVYMY